MNILIILLTLAIPGPPCEFPHKNVTILVDTRSPNPRVKRRSIIASKEPLIKSDLFFPDLTYYLNSRYSITIKEIDWEIVTDELPLFRVGKNSDWVKFSEGTFACSGSCIQSLVSMLKWIDYTKELAEWYATNEYQTAVDHPFLLDTVYQVSETSPYEWVNKKIPMIRTYFKYQIPHPPFIYPQYLEDEIEKISKNIYVYDNRFWLLDEDEKAEILSDKKSKIDPFKLMMLDTIINWHNKNDAYKKKDILVIRGD